MKFWGWGYLIITLIGITYAVFFIDESGYYKVTNENGATLHSSVFTSEKDIIGVAPLDTILKIHNFENHKKAEMIVDGQIIYLKTEDLSLVEKTYDDWKKIQYYVYAVALIIALCYVYRYMKKNHLPILARFKMVVYILLSFSILAYSVYLMKTESEPPHMHPAGKNRIAMKLQFDGYVPPINSEVDVLCKQKYSTLVRDSKGNQFIVPAGGLATKMVGLEKLNENFTYNICKKKLDACIDKDLDSLLAVTGDYVTAMGNVYEFPHLIAVEDDHRIQGVTVATDNHGIVKNIWYNEKERSENIFCKLPFYEEIACRNLYASIDMTGNNSFLDRMFMVLVNFGILGFIVFVLSMTVNTIMFCWGGRSNVVKWTGNILLWILLIPFVYVYALAIIDFYHSMWFVVIIYLFSIVVGAFQFAKDKYGESIYACPSCKKYGVYNPKEVIKKQNIVGKVYCCWPKPPKQINGIWIPQKNYLKETTFKMEGKCKDCGYEDKTLYTRKEEVIGVTECPICGKRMIFSEENKVFHEYCPNCNHHLFVDMSKARYPNKHSNNTNNYSHGNEPVENHDYNSYKGDDLGQAFERDAKDYKDKAEYYLKMYNEAIKKRDEAISEAEWYKSHASFYGDEEFYLRKADEKYRNAHDYDYEAEKLYSDFEYYRSKAEDAQWAAELKKQRN